MEKASKSKNRGDNTEKIIKFEPPEISKGKLKLFEFDGVALKVFTHFDFQAEPNLLETIFEQPVTNHRTNNSSIIDINKQFKGMETDQIIMMVAKTFNWDIENISKSYISSKNSKNEQTSLASDEISRENIDNEIIMRPKSKKLSKTQLFYLKSVIDEGKLSISEISCKYYIWSTTLRKIKHLSHGELNHHPRRNFKTVDAKSKEMIENKITTFYDKWSSPFTSKDVQKHLIENTSVVLPLNKLVQMMKDDLNFTYKRCISRPNNIDLERVKALRCLFSANFIDNLKPDILIWNIDEWTFSRSTKINYSWSLKGQNKEVKNSPFIGNLYMILAIFSNGWWFWLTSRSTINSTVFIYFIKVLNNWLCSQKLFGFRNLECILDNCPSHKSKATIKMLNKLKLKINFLPAYSPNLAPIELWFGFLKKKLATQSRSMIVKLGSIDFHNKLLASMKYLTKELIRTYFSKFYDEIKICINYYK